MKTNLEALNPGKIHITVTGVEWAVYLQKQRTGAMPVFFLGMAPNYADPNDFTVPFLLSSGTYLHTIGYSNATLDARVIEAGSNLDPVTRAQQYHDMSVDVAQECLYIGVYQGSVLTSMRTWITGFEFNPMYSNLYYYLLDKTAGSVSTPIDTFIMGEISGNPDYFDPARDYETAGGEVLQNVFETLVFYDGGHADEFVPMLCTEMPTVANGGISQDGHCYTFHLRHDVKFHDDASIMTAEDVKYSFARELRLNDPNGPAWILGEILIPNYHDYGAGVYGADGNLTASSGVPMSAIDGAIWAKDATTVQFNLSGNDPSFISRLACTGSSIISLNNTNAHSSNKPYSQTAFNYVNGNPIGTGPYKFKLFASGDFVALERFDQYWNTPASIKNILLKQVPTDNVRVSGLIAGDYDAAIVPRAQQQTLYWHSSAVRLTNSSAFNMNFLGLNQNINITGLNPILNDIPSDFFKDVRVRQAFAHAWNFAVFNNQVLAGTAIQPNGVIPKGMFGYSCDVPLYDFNLSTARYLLSVQVEGPPTVPMDLHATPTVYKVSLSWSYPENDGGHPVTMYKLYRSTSQSGTYDLLASPSGLTYNDSAVSSGHTYYYKISAVNSAGEGVQSDPVSAYVPTLQPVSGKVVDANGNGLSGIKVALENSSSVYTDANGDFTIMAAPGSHTLTISGSNVETRTINVAVGMSPYTAGEISATAKPVDYTLVLVLVFVAAAAVWAAVLLVVIRQRAKK